MPEPAPQPLTDATSARPFDAATASETSAASKGGEPGTLSASPLQAPPTCLTQDPFFLRATGPFATPGSPLPLRFGDYEILEEIARGGMGVVYKARQVSLDRFVALKMILAHDRASEETVQRFYREAQAAAGLDHPHIVPVHDMGELEGHHYYIMAFVEGTSLTGLVQKNGPPPTRLAATILLAVAEAVAFAHERGIIHRDLKPANVLIDEKGRPRVADFGLAKQWASDSGLTGAGQPLGTPSYMPPEQVRGQRDRVGPCSDIFGLGGILYYLLTGQAPFQGESVEAVLHQVLHEEPVPPQQLNPQAAPELAALCLKCLEKDPARRYPTAEAVVEALRGVLAGGSPTITRSPQPVASPGQRGGRLLRLWGGLVAALVVIGGVLLTLWWLPGKSTGPSPEDAGEVDKLIRELIPQPGHLQKDFGMQVTMVRDGSGEDGVPGRRHCLGQLVALQGLMTPGLTASMFPQVCVAVGIATRDAADLVGVVPVEEGEKVRFRVWVARNAFVGIWTVEADGTVLQLFPTKHDPNHRFLAGQAREVPADGVEAVPSVGIDAIWVEASTKHWDPVTGERQGPFLLFKQARHKLRWAAQRHDVRGFRPAAGGGLAETVQRYRVAPQH